MVALRSSDVAGFIAKAGRGTPLVLIYGPDEGLVRSRARALADAVLGPDGDAMARVEFEAETLQQDAARLTDEANAIAMFGGRRAITVRNAGKLGKSAWQPLFDVPPLDSIVIFQADELAKSAPLRLAAEQSPHAAAIACYPLSTADIQAEIDRRVAGAGRSLGPPARAYLTELLGADHALSVSELDKLLLYTEGRLAIEIADIEAIVTDASAQAGSEPVDRAFEGKLEEIETAALRSFREGIDPAGLIALALNHALLLRRLASARLEGAFDAAIRAERLFFRREDRIRAQAARWDIAMLARAIEALAAAQDQARRLPVIDETIAVRALWAIALGSRRR